MANELLLPSQEALIQRLLHLACYGQQLVLLSGVNGSGKTSLLAGLADELDTRNLSLVSCPQHVSAQEIRRKIIMQLLPDPLFDDDVSLVDTLLRFVSSLNQPIHILLDDAENLPLVLWAELLLLTGLQAAGYPITVTATVSVEFSQHFVHQLPANQRNALLPITIPALSMAEREGLYQTLMSRSQQQTFTPRKIIVPKLERQQGTPAEVVKLIELALIGESQTAAVRPWKTYLAMATGFLVMSAIVSWYGYKALQPLPEVSRASSVLIPNNTTVIVAFANAIIHPPKSVNLTGVALLGDGSKPIASVAATKTTASVNAKTKTVTESQQAEVQQSDLLRDAQSVADVQTAEIDVDVNQAAAAQIISETEVNSTDREGATAKVAKMNELPTKGYTLQVASVKHQASLAPVLAKLKGRQVMICRHRDWWVVLVGDFSQRANAKQVSKELVASGIASPWLRAWSEVKDYRLERRIADEISS
ncbi:hypothetical protein HR45_17670 [Shewanella mangrovi]|uniref:AAA+ ATPase domain-containing protein n=1 Tax=Shewanella mangrovi TaxID=1515746 RepID=A0A094JAE1_9GAMM|nr:AAA family ATPase [Shewanella mangrovi]KFZ36217.1 hypothetical protein HR45_17670 [Shewanella mangrovi]